MRRCANASRACHAHQRKQLVSFFSTWLRLHPTRPRHRQTSNFQHGFLLLLSSLTRHIPTAHMHLDPLGPTTLITTCPAVRPNNRPHLAFVLSSRPGPSLACPAWATNVPSLLCSRWRKRKKRQGSMPGHLVNNWHFVGCLRYGQRPASLPEEGHMQIHLQPNTSWAASASILPSYHPLGPRAVPPLPKVYVSPAASPGQFTVRFPTRATHSAEATMHAYRMFLKAPAYPLLTYHPAQPPNRPARLTMWNSRWRIAESQPLACFSPFGFMGSLCSVLCTKVSPSRPDFFGFSFSLLWPKDGHHKHALASFEASLAACNHNTGSAMPQKS